MTRTSRRWKTPKFFMCAMSISVNIGLMLAAKLTAIGRSFARGSVAGGLAAVELGAERGPRSVRKFLIMLNGPWSYAPYTDDAASRLAPGRAASG